MFLARELRDMAGLFAALGLRKAHEPMTIASLI